MFIKKVEKKKEEIPAGVRAIDRQMNCASVLCPLANNP